MKYEVGGAKSPGWCFQIIAEEKMQHDEENK